MSGRKPAGARVGALATVTVTAALALAACGSTSSASTTNSSAPSSSSSAYGYKTGAGYTSGTAGVKVSTAKGSAGTYLVGPTGRALYMWVADRHGSSSCSGECAQVWPPLTTTGSAAATGGAVAAELGTTKRSDGSLQVTYKGYPLYYYVADTGPGMIKGQGSNSFGAKWWLLAPSGALITGGGTSSGSSSTTTSSTSSGGGGGWG